MIITNRKGERIEVILDLEKVDIVKNYPYNWCAKFATDNNRYYIFATVYHGIVDGKPKYTATQLTRYLLGVEERVVIDHKNHNTLDNRVENLRVYPYKKNSQHREKENSNNSTGYRNVTYLKREGYYIVQLYIDGRNRRLGRFDDVHEAGKFAEKMRKKYYNTEPK
jgi:hypothetical protein